MPFKRALQPASPPRDAEALTAAMAGIGMGFAAAPSPDPNIEDTLLLASIEAIEGHDLRTLDLLATWFGIHAPWVLADRLTHLVEARGPRLRALWTALARGHAADRRLARLAAGYRGRRLDVLPAGTAFQIGRHGENPRFAGGPLRVPANLLRGRPADIWTPSELARRHRAYRSRIQIGPGYRADMWAALEADPTLTAAALARKTYGSFATAWHVRRDFVLLQSPEGAPPPAAPGGGRRPGCAAARR
jgi:hypothetical protein